MASELPPFSIKERQKAAIIRMLHFNAPEEEDERCDNLWKVLVYDKTCSDIISPLLRVGELRGHGVTLHLPIHADRDPIPDVPAVYFVDANEPSLTRIAKDCARGLYSAFHVNFVTSIPRPLMEKLAEETVRSSSVHRIQRVHDQHIRFVSLEDDLFSLRVRDSYCKFNGLCGTEESRELMDTVVEGLFSVIITTGVIPVIRCRRNTSAAMIAEQLDEKLREHLLNTPPSTSGAFGAGSLHRPVLLLMDRNDDLSVMAHHPWTYQAMVHDMLPLKLNRVTVEVEEAGGPGEASKIKNMVYDLDGALDDFWREYRGSSFPEMASAAHERVNEYKEAKERLNQLGISMDSDESLDTDSILNKTQHLRQFATSVPQLREQKKLIDQHINIATALLAGIRTRELNMFVTVEERLIGKLGVSKSEVVDMLRDAAKGNGMDKLRMLVVYYLCKEDVTAAEMQELEDALGAHPDLDNAFVQSVLSYLKKTIAFNSSGSGGVSTRRAGSAAASSAASSSGFSFVKRGMSSISDVFSLVQSGVESALRSDQKEHFLTRLLRAIMENDNTGRNGGGGGGGGGGSSNGAALDVNSYLYFDPKVQKLRTGEVPRKSTSFREAIVFTIGGGCFTEYENIRQHLSDAVGPINGGSASGSRDVGTSSSKARSVIYGTTEMLTGGEFLEQLSKLGGHGGGATSGGR